ncbi:hypothetical protein NKH18_00385 [Streptomyces sp. M10(2022)]
MKGASDDHPVTYEDPATKEKTTHGTADGRKACLTHCLTYTATQAIVAGAGARALGIRVHRLPPRPRSPSRSERTTQRTAGFPARACWRRSPPRPARAASTNWPRTE